MFMFDTSTLAFLKGQIEALLPLAVLLVVGFFLFVLLFVFFCLAPQFHVVVLFYSQFYAVTVSLCIGEFMM